MRFVLILFMLFSINLTFAQSSFPDFLQGTWKMENAVHYEHWDKLSESSLKGFSYTLKAGQMKVSEYLDISVSNVEITLSATVLNQNQGKGVSFKGSKADSTITFENLKHDFPKKIVYRKLNDTTIFVQISDSQQQGYTYKMQKQFQKIFPKDTTVSNPNYDPVLTQKLGGDDYGMKGYILVILKTGANQTTDTSIINNSFRGHFENMNRMVEKGKLTVAGPIGKNNKSYRGIFILDVTTFEEAEGLLQNDTAIKKGLLDFDLYKWYGPAALPEYLDASDKIWKIKP